MAAGEARGTWCFEVAKPAHSRRGGEKHLEAEAIGFLHVLDEIEIAVAVAERIRVADPAAAE